MSGEGHIADCYHEYTLKMRALVRGKPPLQVLVQQELKPQSNLGDSPAKDKFG